MDIYFFLKGIIIGIAIAAPVGPIGLLCIKRTLEKGRVSGIISGLGAATADATYGLIGGLGVSFISSFLLGIRLYMTLAGSAFLLYLGYKIFTSTPTHKAATATVTAVGLIGDYLSTLFLTITNPVTIISFAGLSAGLGIAKGDYRNAVVLVVGIFLGSALWWLFLTYVLNLLRGKMTDSFMILINRISGGLMIVLGCLSLLSLFFKL